jgi:hypothetical protein
MKQKQAQENVSGLPGPFNPVEVRGIGFTISVGKFERGEDALQPGGFRRDRSARLIAMARRRRLRHCAKRNDDDELGCRNKSLPHAPPSITCRYWVKPGITKSSMTKSRNEISSYL